MTQELVTRIEGRAGRITLNRPGALNALNHDMVRAIERALHEWRDNGGVELVLIDGEGERAFCAGGDVEAIYHAAKRGDFADPRTFWQEEYRLNAMIDRYSKPYVAFMHGFVLGGGVGVSAHGSHRIVCDNTQLTMPECAIGLVPDVGGTYLLGRSSGYLGEFIGLTGFRMGAADAIFTGFADCHVPYSAFEALKQQLVATGNIAACLAHYATEPPAGFLQTCQAEIDAIFGLATLDEIMAALAVSKAGWAEKARAGMARAAPLSLLATFRLIRMARQTNNLAAALEQEYRFTARAAEQTEFLEGVRATLIDKDRTPKWRYPTLGDVPPALIDELLAPLSAL